MSETNSTDRHRVGAERRLVRSRPAARLMAASASAMAPGGAGLGPAAAPEGTAPTDGTGSGAVPAGGVAGSRRGSTSTGVAGGNALAASAAAVEDSVGAECRVGGHRRALRSTLYGSLRTRMQRGAGRAVGDGGRLLGDHDTGPARLDMRSRQKASTSSRPRRPTWSRPAGSSSASAPRVPRARAPRARSRDRRRPRPTDRCRRVRSSPRRCGPRARRRARQPRRLRRRWAGPGSAGSCR